jgi:RNA polymerase sigma-70 factor (ECF subfamily)
MDPAKAAALAREFEGGSKEAFSELYEAYLKPIYNFIYFKTHHKETAEDLSAQVFMKAYRSVANFRADKGTFQAWVYQIARRTVIDHYRSSKHTINIDDVWDLGSNENIESDADNRLMLDEVKKYINGLPSDQRDVLIMRIWQELSYSEIAQIMNKSEASCKMMFSRAIKKLRSVMPEAALMVLMILAIKNQTI